MEPEVAAAIIGTPAVLITAVTGWLAGRAQGRSTYHGAVDAVRREAQRQAYADPYQAAVRFVDAEKAVGVATLRGGTAAIPRQRAQDSALEDLDRAAALVYLEGPEELAKIAERICWTAHLVGGRNYLPPCSTETKPVSSVSPFAPMGTEALRPRLQSPTR
ncbi:hypothetical protein ACFYWP_41205 [Actinacidiphila glaucinigra]|uniref:hypothetical protein n=1 Tax=Actinacidiphila glaucinigra TaxID=235986 RepID=UPI0036B53F27